MATLKGIWVFNDEIEINGNVYSTYFSLANGVYFVEKISERDNPASSIPTMGYFRLWYFLVGESEWLKVYEGGWIENDYGIDARTINILDEPTDEAFITWLTANATQQASEETSGVTIEYNGSVVATVEGGNKATIPVADKKMKTDIVITVPEAEGEVLPEFTEVEDFTVMVSGLEGEMEISYDVSEKVALPSGYNQLTSVNDANFIASNIKKGVSIFDLVGAYEGETIEEYDGTIVIEDIAPEEEKVNITLKADNGGGNTMCSTYVKFGEAPSSNYDSEYFCMGGALDIKQGNESSYGSYVSLGTDSINIAVNPVAYIWVPQTDNMAGYKLNGSSLINVGTGYANATEVQLSEGDVLTILSTWLD